MDVRRQWTIDGRDANAMDGHAVRAVSHGLVKAKEAPSGVMIMRPVTVRRPLGGTV